MLFLFMILFVGCSSDDDGIRNPDDGENPQNPDNPNNPDPNEETVFILIDDDSIDNGNEPNNFSAVDVNDPLAEIGQRQPLAYFANNVGRTLWLYTGQVGDEGWFALGSVPNTWASAGPGNNGLRNYLVPGPGLGGGSDDREVLLDEIPNVIPLRATGLSMLQGQKVFAVVYDSDISVNYDPMKGNLQGANLGVVAFEVLDVEARGGDSNLPRVQIRILNADNVEDGALHLFTNAPEPESSSEPEDTNPPANPPAIALSGAN